MFQHKYMFTLHGHRSVSLACFSFKMFPRIGVFNQYRKWRKREIQVRNEGKGIQGWEKRVENEETNRARKLCGINLTVNKCWSLGIPAIHPTLTYGALLPSIPLFCLQFPFHQHIFLLPGSPSISNLTLLISPKPKQQMLKCQSAFPSLMNSQKSKTLTKNTIRNLTNYVFMYPKNQKHAGPSHITEFRYQRLPNGFSSFYTLLIKPVMPG